MSFVTPAKELFMRHSQTIDGFIRPACVTALRFLGCNGSTGGVRPPVEHCDRIRIKRSDRVVGKVHPGQTCLGQARIFLGPRRRPLSDRRWWKRRRFRNSKPRRRKTITNSSASLTFALGRVRTVGALYVQSDANDIYRIPGSADGAPGTFQVVATVEDAFACGHGLRDRAFPLAVSRIVQNVIAHLKEHHG